MTRRGASSISSRSRDYLLGRSLKVFGRYLVEELPEAFDLGLLLVRDRDSGDLEHRLVGVDDGAGADRESDRIRGPRRDRGPVAEAQVGVVDAVAQLGDHDRIQV